jgi:hypothetical protein
MKDFQIAYKGSKNKTAKLNSKPELKGIDLPHLKTSIHSNRRNLPRKRRRASRTLLILFRTFRKSQRILNLTLIRPIDRFI